MKLRLTSLAILAAFATGAQAASTGISNGTVSATIHDNGSFEVYGAGPSLSYMGVEFVKIDTRSAWWVVEDGGATVAQYDAGGFPGTSTMGGGTTALTTAFNNPGWSFVQTAALVAPNQLAVSVILTNNTGAAVKDVYYGVGFDPDQGGSGRNATWNTVNAQGANASVTATRDWLRDHKLYSVTLANTTSAAATAIEAYVNKGNCCSWVSPKSVITTAGAQAGYQGFADDSISLAYHYGSIGAGESVTIGYSYTFAAVVPEPETYAMFLAGLGLMGVVARRRTRV